MSEFALCDLSVISHTSKTKEEEPSCEVSGNVTNPELIKD